MFNMTTDNENSMLAMAAKYSPSILQDNIIVNCGPYSAIYNNCLGDNGMTAFKHFFTNDFALDTGMLSDEHLIFAALSNLAYALPFCSSDPNDQSPRAYSFDELFKPMIDSIPNQNNVNSKQKDVENCTRTYLNVDFRNKFVSARKLTSHVFHPFKKIWRVPFEVAREALKVFKAFIKAN